MERRLPVASDVSVLASRGPAPISVCGVSIAGDVYDTDVILVRASFLAVDALRTFVLSSPLL
jgi:hypothetical protein